MSKKDKALIAAILLAIFLCGLVGYMMGTVIIVHAEPIRKVSSSATMKVDAGGNRYIVKHGKKQTGLIKYRGNIYYGHRTKSACYPVGSLATDCFKEIDGDWYYFGKTGKAQKHDSRYIDIRSRNWTVRDIYTPGTGKKQRYHTRTKRYQVRKGGKWRTVGMQTYPYGQMDWQP